MCKTDTHAGAAISSAPLRLNVLFFLVQALVTSLEKHVLGCWRGLLLPSSEDHGPAQEASRLQKLLQECGWKYPDAALLKVS